jgi:hypothetical protein
MDIQGNTKVFFPDSCARTANVQVTDAATSATFIGPGELVVTNAAGTVLTTATALASVPVIRLVHRAKNGTMRPFAEIRKQDVTGYFGKNYVAAAPLVHVVTLDAGVASLTDHTFTLSFSNAGYTNCDLFTRSVSYTVTTAETVTQIATGLAAAINSYFDTRNTDGTTFSATAAVVNDKVVITAGEFLDPLTLNNVYEPTRFTVVATSFKATITDNKTGTVSDGTTTYDQMTRGAGTNFEAIQVERRGLGFSSSGYTQVAFAPYELTKSYDAKQFESDGSTSARYDVLVINWEHSHNSLTNYTKRGNIRIFLPVEDNATSQVGVATVGIVPVLNKYFVTELGIGTAFTVTTP